MDLFHVLADSLNLDRQKVDGLIARLKHFPSGIKGILSCLQLLLSTQKVFSLEAFELVRRINALQSNSPVVAHLLCWRVLYTYVLCVSLLYHTSSYLDVSVTLWKHRWHVWMNVRCVQWSHCSVPGEQWRRVCVFCVDCMWYLSTLNEMVLTFH